jgi:hypothetical protein
VRYNPKDKAVVAALSRIKQSRAEELAKPGKYRTGNAKENCLQEGTLCVVCQDDIGSSDTISKLPCNHDFHEKCFGEWMQN